jgi:hypothetical protein
MDHINKKSNREPELSENDNATRPGTSKATSEQAAKTGSGAMEGEGRFAKLLAELHAREREGDSRKRDPREREDARYAESLMERRWVEYLHPHEVEWLESWQANHENPDRNDVCDGRMWAQDLGVGLAGLEVFGARNRDELGNGNVNIAGGWFFRVGSTEDDRGWPRGWWSEVHGLDAFLEAMGLDPMPEASEPLGPFYNQRHPTNDRVRAYEELAKRLLAVLIIVSRAALEANPEAHKRMEQQRATYEQRLGETTFEELRRKLEGGE